MRPKPLHPPEYGQKEYVGDVRKIEGRGLFLILVGVLVILAGFIYAVLF